MTEIERRYQEEKAEKLLRHEGREDTVFESECLICCDFLGSNVSDS